MNKTAVIILNWNGKHFLESFLPLLEQHTSGPEVELVVADNGSTDGSVDWIRTVHPGIRIITFETNLGFSGGYNRAIESTESEYVVLLNSDVEITKGWLEPMVNLLEGDNSIAACMPNIHSYLRREHFEYAGAAGGFIDVLGYPFCRGRILGNIERDRQQYDEKREIFWASGACMLIRRDLYLEAGGLDEKFFAHMEEIDLCWRLKNMGYRIFSCPSSKIYHVGGGTLPNEHPHKLFLNYRNNLLTLCKNLPGGRRRWIFPLRFILDMTASLVYLLKMQPLSCLAIYKAYFGFFGLIGHCKRFRKNWMNKYSLLSHKEVFKGSILVEFFLKKSRHFNQLDL